jgi:hypothetical protein
MRYEVSFETMNCLRHALNAYIYIEFRYDMIDNLQRLRILICFLFDHFVLINFIHKYRIRKSRGFNFFCLNHNSEKTKIFTLKNL